MKILIALFVFNVAVCHFGNAATLERVAVDGIVPTVDDIAKPVQITDDVEAIVKESIVEIIPKIQESEVVVAKVVEIPVVAENAEIVKVVPASGEVKSEIIEESKEKEQSPAVVAGPIEVVLPKVAPPEVASPEVAAPEVVLPEVPAAELAPIKNDPVPDIVASSTVQPAAELIQPTVTNEPVVTVNGTEKQLEVIGTFVSGLFGGGSAPATNAAESNTTSTDIWSVFTTSVGNLINPPSSNSGVQNQNPLTTLFGFVSSANSSPTKVETPNSEGPKEEVTDKVTEEAVTPVVNAETSSTTVESVVS